jgi:hypothetical protein
MLLIILVIRRGLKDNIGTDSTEIEGENVNWIHLAQDREQWWVLVNMVVNILEP